LKEYAAKRARVLFGSFRKDEAADPGVYVAAVTAVLCTFPADVVKAVTNPTTGLAVQKHVLPSVRDVYLACEELMRPAREAEARRARIDKQLAERVEFEFRQTWAAFPAHETMRRDLALEEYRKLEPAKQKLCRAAVPLYAAALAKHGKKPMALHQWIKIGGFEDFPNAKLPEEMPTRIHRFVQGDELAGWRVAFRIATRREIRLVTDDKLGRGIWASDQAQPDLVALAPFDNADRSAWCFVDHQSSQFAAWRDRLKLWLPSIELEPERVWLEDFDPNVHGLSAMDPAFRLRRANHGLRVPRKFPPRRDGSWFEGNDANHDA